MTERGKVGGTDITVTTMSRTSNPGQQQVRRNSSTSGASRNSRLPPLVFPQVTASSSLQDGGGMMNSNTRRIVNNSKGGLLLSPSSSRRIPGGGGGVGAPPSSLSRRSSGASVGSSGGNSSSNTNNTILPGGGLFLMSASVPASPTMTSTSKYHSSCCLPNSLSSPSGFGYDHQAGTIKGRARQRSRSRSPSSSSSITNNKGGVATSANRVNQGEMEPDKVEEYLLQNPDFLENYVTRNVDQETLEGWLIERHKVAQSRKSSLSRWKYGAGGSDSRKNMLQELAKSLQRNSQEGSVMWELALCISSAVNADSFTLYLSDSAGNMLTRYVALNGNSTMSSNTSSSMSTTTSEESSGAVVAGTGAGEPKRYILSDGLTMASYVGQRRSPLRLTRMEAEGRFPEGLGEGGDHQPGQAYHILCHPIIRADGELAGVVELYRMNSGTPFYAEDEEVVNSYVVWGGIALHYAELNAVMHKQKKLNDFLLNVVKSIFQDMVSMDTLIKKVMNYAQKLVDADRASLFLLDNKNKELYARLFDMGGGQDYVMNPDASAKEPTKEIRFSIGTGIAGQVAATGQILNIPDAYADDRFNRAVDQITGYHTKSILCMPVFIRSTVIGVVQMVNKRSGPFTKDDEEAFQTFAVYCGLALHHAKLYDKIRRSEQKFKVALEVLSYHNTCNDDEFVRYKAQGVPQTVIGLDDYYFLPMSIDDNLKVHYTLYMFIDLFGLSRFDSDHLYRFVLTVRKNYRRVPYHNWTHGFTVANSMYCILKKSEVFRPLECLALFVGCLCHDLDHRGRSNKFMLDMQSPLASIYTTSTMEHHHFNQTVTILQQEGHNIFSKLSSEEYKQVLGNIKHCILATDLALFFPNKARLADLVAREAFSWGVPDHRLLIEAIAMTAADLCASTKPWDAQVETVKVIFEEFYEQGDIEKAAGRVPIPMMDREKQDEQAASQVGFLSGICIPCYSLLEKLITETKPMLDGVEKNLSRWKELAEEQKGNKEAREKLEAEAEERNKQNSSLKMNGSK